MVRPSNFDRGPPCCFISQQFLLDSLGFSLRDVVSHQKSEFRSAQGSRGHQRNRIVAVLDADGVAYKEAEAAAQRLVADLRHAKAVDAHIGIRVLERRPHAGCAQPTNFLSPLTIIIIIVTRYSCQRRQGASCRHSSDDGQ